MLAALAFVYSSRSSIARVSDLSFLTFAGSKIHGADYTVAKVDCRKKQTEWQCFSQSGARLADFEIRCDDAEPGYIVLDSCTISMLAVLDNARLHGTTFSEQNDLITPPDDGPIFYAVNLRNTPQLHFQRGKRVVSRQNKHQVQMVYEPENEVQLDQMDCYNVGFDGVSVLWRCDSNDLGKNQIIRKATVICEEWATPSDGYVVDGSCYVRYEVGKASKWGKK